MAFKVIFAKNKAALTVSEQRMRRLENRVEELEETIEIMSDKKLLRSIERGLADLRHGKYKRYEGTESLFADIESSR